MSEVTAEQAFAAAEVLDALDELIGVKRHYSANDVRYRAQNLARADKRIEELAKWLSIHIGNWPEDEWELCAKPNYWHGRANDLAAAYPSLLDETSATS